MPQTSMKTTSRDLGGEGEAGAAMAIRRSAPRSATSLARKVAGPLACSAALLVGGCASERRPAWEQMAVMRSPPPGASAGRLATSRTAAVRADHSGNQEKPQPRRQASTTAAGSADSRSSPGPVKPRVPPAATAPTWTTGGAVAALAPFDETARQTVHPAWIGVDTHMARHEDTLLDLAVEHNLGFIELAVANPNIDPWLPGEGTEVVVPKMHLPPDASPRGIVLNLPEQRLYHYEKGQLLHSYPVGIGRDGHSTPTGSTTIVRKQANPTWYPTASARQEDPTLPAGVPPGPDNPLGNRAMYLGWSRYLIHGTNKEYGIGRRASRGCIRMYSDDAAALYDRIAIGTPVTVVNQPIKIGWIEKDLYIEASPTMAQVQLWEKHGNFGPASAANIRRSVLKKAGVNANRVDWAAVDRAVRERRGIVTRITKPLAPSMVASAAGMHDDDPSHRFFGWLRRQFSFGGP